jgi:hypothetical protein
MPEEPGPKDLGSVWRDQPEEKLPVNLEQFAKRRTRELYSSTRSEILTSIGAGVFFVALIGWRFASAHERLPPLGSIGAITAIVWALITLYWFRDRIWRAGGPRKDALAATGMEYYRNELQRRRDHLRNAWVWHGPLFLACLVLVAIVAGKAFPGFDRLENTLPLFVLLAVWTGFGIRCRRLQADAMQREIGEIDRPPGPEQPV